MIDLNGKKYKEVRCYRCQKFVVYANVSAGNLAYQCPRCGFMNEWTFMYYKSKDNQDIMEKEFSISERG